MTGIEAAELWINTCLDKVGDDPDVIEEKLNFFGCAGIPGDPDASPLGFYLEQRMTVKSPRVVRHPDGYRVETDGYEAAISLEVPKAVGVFLMLFDAGYYPFLVGLPTH